MLCMTLKEYFETHEKTQDGLAKHLETSQANISRWLNGVVLPNGEFMISIWEYTGGLVTPSDFKNTTESK